jgi:hypothetical protein
MVEQPLVNTNNKRFGLPHCVKTLFSIADEPQAMLLRQISAEPARTELYNNALSPGTVDSAVFI